MHLHNSYTCRASRQQSTPIDFSRDGTSEQFDDKRGSMPALNLTRDTVESQNVVVEPKRKPLPSGDQVGVMRPGSRTREYDLIPGNIFFHVNWPAQSQCCHENPPKDCLDHFLSLE